LSSSISIDVKYCSKCSLTLIPSFYIPDGLLCLRGKVLWRAIRHLHLVGRRHLPGKEAEKEIDQQKPGHFYVFRVKGVFKQFRGWIKMSEKI